MRPTRARGACGVTTLVLAALAVTVWGFVGMAVVLGSAFESEAPAPPGEREVPLPDGWQIVRSERCVGSHCSERDLMFSGPPSGGDVCVAWTASLEDSGWTIRQPCDGPENWLAAAKDGVGLTVTAEGTGSAANGTLSFESDEAGRRYHERSDAPLSLFVALGAVLTVATAATGTAYVMMRPRPRNLPSGATRNRRIRQ